MKALFTIVLIACSFLLSAQDWCHQGSKWSYGYFDLSPAEGNVTIWYQKDTVVMGITCKKIISEFLINLMLADTTIPARGSNGPFYTFSKNDTVFFLESDGFKPIYFFGAAVGDTITYVVSDQSNWGGGIYDSLVQIIDSTGIDTIDNQPLRYYVVRNTNPYINPPTQRMTERFGSPTYLEPLFSPGTDGPGYSFQCYQDDSFQVYQINSTVACNYLTSIMEQSAQIRNIRPNPAVDYTIVDYNITDWSNAPTTLQIYNAIGQLMYSHQLTTPSRSQQIEVSSFAAGIYAVCIKLNNGIQVNGKLVKE